MNQVAVFHVNSLKVLLLVGELDVFEFFLEGESVAHLIK